MDQNVLDRSYKLDSINLLLTIETINENNNKGNETAAEETYFG